MEKEIKKHSSLQPSASHRWINCSGSYLLPQYIPDKDTRAADEGTLVHKLSEYKLIRDDWYDYSEEIEECRNDPLYHPVMEHYSDNYVAFINDKEYDKRLIEETVDLSFIYTDFFGTADCILMTGGESPSLEIIDLKYGKFPVDPTENSQLMIYALGAVRLFQKEFPETKTLKNFLISLTIYQPRINNITTWETDWEDLSEWNTKYLIPALSKIKFDVIEENKGNWCRFCNAQTFCKAFNDVYIGFDPEKIETLSDSQIENNFEVLSQLESYLKTLKSYISDSIKQGKRFENYKLVAGSNKRYWKDEDGLREKLRENNKLNEVLELPSPNQLSRKLGKKTMEEQYNQFIGTKSNNPLLVKRSDKRKELIFED